MGEPLYLKSDKYYKKNKSNTEKKIKRLGKLKSEEEIRDKMLDKKEKKITSLEKKEDRRGTGYGLFKYNSFGPDSQKLQKKITKKTDRKIARAKRKTIKIESRYKKKKDKIEKRHGKNLDKYSTDAKNSSITYKSKKSSPPKNKYISDSFKRGKTKNPQEWI
tara:strand:+ start:116 stop:601 length:486 start_codon:yes stop_codon:yes gene_type:complete